LGGGFAGFYQAGDDLPGVAEVIVVGAEELEEFCFADGLADDEALDHVVAGFHCWKE
jgi:hypothetical protein